jgi:SAM-dependent methyltransferase
MPYRKVIALSDPRFKTRSLERGALASCYNGDAVLPSATTSLVDVLACPSCHGELVERAGGLACAACGRAYAIEDGVADLVLHRTPSADGTAPGIVGRAVGSIAAVPVVYDLVQRLANSKDASRRLARVLSDAAGALVLDAGAGTGRLEESLPHSSRYLWLDPDPRKLKGFRAKSSSPAILGDATRIPLRDDSVDWAISIGVSHHLDDAALGRMLDELRRVTRDRLVFLDGVVSSSLTSRLLWHYDRGRHPRTIDVLKRELAARFELATVEEFTILHRYLLVSAI